VVAVFKPSAQVLYRQLDESAVLIHLETNQIYELNATGRRIWELVQEGLDRDAIADRIQQEFAVGGEQLREIDDLLAALLAKQLISGNT
jgi:hypothetical protein